MICPHCGGRLKVFDAYRTYIDEEDIERERAAADKAYRRIEARLRGNIFRRIASRLRTALKARGLT